MTPEPWMQDLQEGYIRNLPAKLDEIRNLALHARAAPTDTETIRCLAHAVQRLVGSAGSYGFPAISDSLGPAARMLAQAEDGRLPMSGPDLARLLDLLDGIADDLPRTG